MRDACNGSYDFVTKAAIYAGDYYTPEVLRWALADAQDAAKIVTGRNAYYLDDCCCIRQAIKLKEAKIAKAARKAARMAHA